MLKLVVLVGAIVGIMYLLMRPKTPTTASGFIAGLLGQQTDQAIGQDIETGAGWYDYWKKTLTGAYQSVGNMPPGGPLDMTIACIVAPCEYPGTPRPKSP